MIIKGVDDVEKVEYNIQRTCTTINCYRVRVTIGSGYLIIIRRRLG